MKKQITFLLIYIILTTIYSSIFIIKEGEQGIKLQYNEKLYNNNYQKKIIFYPGIHFKIPFLEYIKKTSSLTKITNLNNNNINYYIKWKIIDPFKYYTKTKFNNKLTIYVIKNILKKNILNIITIKKNINQTNKPNYNSIIEQIKKININNKNLNINKMNIKYFQHLGIKIIDIRINKIHLKKQIYHIIYKHMESNQKQKINNENISSKINSLKIRSYAQYQSKKTLNQAKKQAIIIKNEGKLQANKIFIKYIKQDPEFYYFIRSLKAYRNIFNNKKTNLIILDTNMDFLKYINKKK